VAFQQAILGLRERGVILAIASKNNPPEVAEVFASHPHMVLRKEHFACQQIDWGAKTDSLKQIAAHLNIGLDQVVFVDDNPAECDQVEDALPVVTVIRLPPQPEYFVRAVLERGLFDALSISAEDAQRGELYRQRAEAEELRGKSQSLEEFYARLEMEVTFAPVNDASLARASQLTLKTNQFNVTTIRYPESELGRRLTDPAWLMTTVRVRDHYGDNGIVGLMMARIVEDALDIDTFLLSCRVIGRTVETSMLAYLCEQSLQRRLKRLRGTVIATAKNEPCRDLYQRHDFSQVPQAVPGQTSWELDIAQRQIDFPQWFQVKRET
jgi:FkbH-like protein